MSREEWLKSRKTGIGSSDSSQLLGVSTYGTTLNVYLDKINPEVDTNMSESQRIGLELEPAIIESTARRWVEQNPGDEVKVIPAEGTYQHEKYPHLLATPDAFLSINGDLVDLSCKSTRLHEEYEDDNLPDHARVQSLHMMEVIPELKFSVVGALLLFKPEIVLRTVEKDEQIQQAITEAGNNFWLNHVQKQIPPSLEEASYQSITQLYPQDDGSEIILPEDIRQMVIEHRKLAAEEKRFKEAKKEVQANIVAHFGEAQVGLGGTVQASWKTQKEMRVNVDRLKTEEPEIALRFTEEKTKRVFRTKEIK